MAHEHVCVTMCASESVWVAAPVPVFAFLSLMWLQDFSHKEEENKVFAVNSKKTKRCACLCNGIWACASFWSSPTVVADMFFQCLIRVNVPRLGSYNLPEFLWLLIKAPSICNLNSKILCNSSFQSFFFLLEPRCACTQDIMSSAIVWRHGFIETHDACLDLRCLFFFFEEYGIINGCVQTHYAEVKVIKQELNSGMAHMVGSFSIERFCSSMFLQGETSCCMYIPSDFHVRARVREENEIVLSDISQTCVLVFLSLQSTVSLTINTTKLWPWYVYIITHCKCHASFWLLIHRFKWHFHMIILLLNKHLL